MASEPDDVLLEITNFLAGCLDLDLRHIDGTPEPLRGLLGGSPKLIKRIQHDFKTTVERALKFDPVAVSALRVVHAVLVAAQRQDEESLLALREWERHTLSYMQKHAFAEYLTLGMPPRPVQRRQDRHDRHLIVATLAERITSYLKQCDQAASAPPTGPLAKLLTHEIGIAACLGMMVTTTFPDLIEGSPLEVGSDGENKKIRIIMERIKEYRELGRPLAELDPEQIILDALEALGVPRPTGHNWLRAVK